MRFGRLAVAALAVSLLACSPEDTVLPFCATQGDLDTEQAQPQLVVLSNVERIRAIAARSRLERGGRAPTETISRTYDRYGRVTSERVKVGDRWENRRSTLPSQLAEQPLSAYLESVEANAKLSLLASIAPVTAVFVDTLDGQPVTTTDTIWTTPAFASQVMLRTSTMGGLAWEGDLYYPDSSSTADPMLSTTASIVSGMPGGDDVVEESYTGGDWWTAKYNLQNMSGYPGGSLREANSGDGGPMRATSSINAAMSGDLLTLNADCFTVVSAKENCEHWRQGRAGFVGTAFLAAGAGVVAAAVPGGQGASWWFLKASGTAILSAVASHIAYKTCLLGP